MGLQKACFYRSKTSRRRARVVFFWSRRSHFTKKVGAWQELENKIAFRRGHTRPSNQYFFLSERFYKTLGTSRQKYISRRKVPPIINTAHRRTQNITATEEMDAIAKNASHFATVPYSCQRVDHGALAGALAGALIFPPARPQGISQRHLVSPVIKSSQSIKNPTTLRS